MNIIELDKYLNLNIEPLHTEFLNVVDTIPKKYWNMFYSNLDKDDPEGIFEKDSPEVKTIYLTDVIDGVDMSTEYFLIDKGEYWIDLPIYDKFPTIKKMVTNLPFEHTGRIMLIFSKIGEEIVTHFDHECKEWRQEFIWISLNDAKKLFIMENNQPIYLQGSSCWFDSQKSHGTKSNGYSISMRIDGKFKSDFRNKIFGDGSEWQTIKKW
jgi:hypothetical protein